MSVKDFIKKSVLENFSPYNVPQMAAALLAAVLLGALIYWVYQRFYAGVLFSRSFAMTLVGMSVLTCMVTLAISSNVVISLGMVGALSIVRFRTAVTGSAVSVLGHHGGHHHRRGNVPVGRVGVCGDDRGPRPALPLADGRPHLCGGAALSGRKAGG